MLYVGWMGWDGMVIRGHRVLRPPSVLINRHRHGRWWKRTRKGQWRRGRSGGGERRWTSSYLSFSTQRSLFSYSEHMYTSSSSSSSSFSTPRSLSNTHHPPPPCHNSDHCSTLVNICTHHHHLPPPCHNSDQWSLSRAKFSLSAAAQRRNQPWLKRSSAPCRHRLTMMLIMRWIVLIITIMRKK